MGSYALSAGQISKAQSLFTDGTGNVWAVGFARDATGYSHFIVQKSTDSGGTWSVISDQTHSIGFNSQSSSGARDSAGRIFVTGSGIDSSSIRHWTTRWSTDGGSSWAGSDDYNLAAGKDAHANSMTVDASDNLYAAGYALDSSSLYHQVVRRSTDQGATWSTVDNFNYTAGQHSIASAIAVDGNTPANAYACSTGWQSALVGHFLVRKGTNAGGAWSTVSDFNLVAGKSAGCNGIAVNGNTVYAVGSAVDASNISHWIVRKSTDAGASWTTVRDYNFAASKDALAYSVLIDGAGTVYVAGAADTTASGAKHWMVQKSTDGGSSWTMVDDYVMSAGRNNYPQSIGKDSLGRIYVTGYSLTSSNLQRSIVRRSGDGGATWNTVDLLSLEGRSSLNTSIFECLSGRMCTVGVINDKDSVLRWSVRQLSP